MRKTNKHKIAVFDCETDPFKVGRIPEPFCCGFYDGETYMQWWGPECVNTFCMWLEDQEQDYLIYAHNGGKFDFWFMLDEIDDTKQIFIINGRIVEFSMKGSNHVFRDSLAIIPVPLSAYQKEDIDYGIFESQKRNLPTNRILILNYLKSDCFNLFDIVSRFADRFSKDGNVPISVGQASIRELMVVHPFSIMTEASDQEIRPWYMGGRVQCFASGVLKGPWKVFDVNSMYPGVMKHYVHPLSDLYESLEKPPRTRKSVWFAEFEGSNRNALPKVTDAGLDFTVPYGTFVACSHELVPAIKAGLVKVDNWIEVLQPSEVGNFSRFVDKFSKEKIVYKKAGDKANEMLSKFILNSAYGKTGQNPEDFKDYKILRDPMKDKGLRELGFEPDIRIQDDPFIEVWSRKSGNYRGSGYYNVGIAASVTSAARAVLLEGLQQAVEPIYCDTDSIICRDFMGDVDPSRLGAWKLEATAEYAAIAGKKLYCLYNKVGRKIVPVKWASKGGDLDPLDIIDIANGATVEFASEVPTYSLSRGISFISRNFRKTVDEAQPFK